MGLTQVSTDGVKNDAITKTKIPANQIEASELADNAVDTNAIANGAVTSGKIASGTITNANLNTYAGIVGSKLADSSVGSAKIADQAVTLDKLPHGTSSNDGKFLRANNGADPSFETVTSTTINNNADNRVITGSGTANTLEGEANLTFGSDVLNISSTTQGLGARFTNTGNEYTNLQFSANRTGANQALGIINAKWNNSTEVAAIYLTAGVDTSNKDDGAIKFYTCPSGGSLIERLAINPDGHVSMPSQPVYIGEGTNYSQHSSNFSTVIPQSNLLIRGFTHSSGVFTVPTDGVYYFAINYLYHPNSETAYMSSRIVVDTGSGYSQRADQIQGGGNATGHSDQTYIQLLDLNANDSFKFQFKTATGEVHSGQANWSIYKVA